MEPYAQEQGWSVEGGNRAMFGDDFQMAAAVWQLFSSGAAGMDVTNKEAFVRDYMSQATTPGGTFYTEGQVTEAMFNGPADSTFNLTIQRLAPDQQVDYTISTYVNALHSTVPAPMLAARTAQMDAGGRHRHVVHPMAARHRKDVAHGSQPLQPLRRLRHRRRHRRRAADADRLAEPRLEAAARHQRRGRPGLDHLAADARLRDRAAR